MKNYIEVKNWKGLTKLVQEIDTIPKEKTLILTGHKWKWNKNGTRKTTGLILSKARLGEKMPVFKLLQKLTTEF